MDCAGTLEHKRIFDNMFRPKMKSCAQYFSPDNTIQPMR